MVCPCIAGMSMTPAWPPHLATRLWVGAPTLGGSPMVLSQPAEPMQAFSGLLHIEAEALSDGGSYFAREAVIALERRGALSYRVRLWRRGARVLFPVTEEVR